MFSESGLYMVKGHSGVKGVAVLTYLRFLWSVQPMNASTILILFHRRNFALAPFYSLWGSYGEKTAPSAQIRFYQSGVCQPPQKTSLVWSITWGNFIANTVPSSLLYTILFHRTFVLTVCLLVLADFGDNPLQAPDTVSYTVLTHPHAPTQGTYYLCTYSHTQREAEVRSQPASAFLRFTLCSHAHAPPFHLVTAYLPVSLSVPLIPHLSPQLSIFPSHLLSFHRLPLRLLLSVSFRVCTDSVFCRCGAFMERGAFSARNGDLLCTKWRCHDPGIYPICKDTKMKA